MMIEWQAAAAALVVVVVATVVLMAANDRAKMEKEAAATTADAFDDEDEEDTAVPRDVEETLEYQARVGSGTTQGASQHHRKKTLDVKEVERVVLVDGADRDGGGEADPDEDDYDDEDIELYMTTTTPHKPKAALVAAGVAFLALAANCTTVFMTTATAEPAPSRP